MKLTILREAELEAAEAAAWYDDCRVGLGDEFLSELSQAFANIAADPNALSRLESYHGTRDVRRCVLQRFPYLVVYACQPAELLVVAVAHTRRRPLYWLERLD